MATRLQRGARATAPLALVLSAAALVAGCSGGKSTTSAPALSPSPSSVAATGNAAATAALARAEHTLAATHSYAYAAFETVQAKTPVTSRVTGVVVRNQGVAYTLTVGRVRTQVVRLRAATYVRKVPGRWSKLRTAHRIADPIGTLDAVLRGLTGAVATQSTVGTSVAGELPPAAAKSAGIPTDGSPAQVVVDLDPAGHVTRLTVHTSTTAGTTKVAVTLDTTYSRFGAVRAIAKPV